MWINQNGDPETVAYQLSRRRLIILAIYVPLYALIQGVVFTEMTTKGTINWTSVLAATLPMTLIMLSFLRAGGWNGRMTPQVQAIFDDEAARANRAEAQRTGFWTAVIAAGALLGLTAWLELTGAQTGFLVLTLATGAASLHFVLLEWQGLKGLGGNGPAANGVAGRSH